MRLCSHEVTLSTPPPYQSGPLGNYYLATSSVLYDTAKRGSRSVADAGLYHYTTRVDQVKDGAQSGNVIIGHHYVATASSSSTTPKDTDNDGIPDYFENWHGDGRYDLHMDTETDWQNNKTDGVNFDAFNAIYDSADLDGDGLVGAAEKLLGTNPLISDSPLNLPANIQQSSLSGVVTIPLQISPSLNDDTPFTLFVDGQEANAVVRKVSGSWVAQWDTTTTPNGAHSLSLRFNFPNPNDASLRSDCFGGSSIVAVNNRLTFTTLNSTFCDLLVIDATVNNSASSYSIKVYDAATYNPGTSTPLTTLSGNVSNGEIENSWDLTDGQGNTISTGPVTCEFLFDGGPATVTKTWPKFLHNPCNDKFTLAWGVDNVSPSIWGEYEWDMCSVVDELTAFYDPFPDPNLSYYILPYGASGNVNNPGGDLSFTFSKNYPDSKTALLNALYDSGNFFWVGHGCPNHITPNPGVFYDSPELTAKEISQKLGNPQTLLNGNSYVMRPYKLVVLFGCNAYSSDFATAFGIADFMSARPAATSDQTFNPYYLPGGRSTSTVESYGNQGKCAQAYVGWPCGVNRPTTIGTLDQEVSNFIDTFALWQSDTQPHYTITQCINLLAGLEAGNLPTVTDPDGIVGVLKWELSGCYDLRITDRWP
jgi:hypothetical protein